MKDSYIDTSEIEEIKNDLEGLYGHISAIRHLNLENRIKGSHKALSLLDCIIFKLDELQKSKENEK